VLAGTLQHTVMTWCRPCSTPISDRPKRGLTQLSALLFLLFSRVPHEIPADPLTSPVRDASHRTVATAKGSSVDHPSEEASLKDPSSNGSTEMTSLEQLTKTAISPDPVWIPPTSTLGSSTRTALLTPEDDASAE
jgi:hypothetical protein